MKIYTNKSFTKEVTSKYDKEYPPTKFRIGLLTTNERETINAQVKFGDEAAASKVIRSVIEIGLKGWDGLKNENDEPIEFKTISKSVLGLPVREVISPELYDLPQMYDLWLELSTQIRDFNSLTEPDAKK